MVPSYQIDATKYVALQYLDAQFIADWVFMGIMKGGCRRMRIRMHR